MISSVVKTISSEKLEHNGLSFQFMYLPLFRKRVGLKRWAVRISPLLLIHEMPWNKSDSKFNPPKITKGTVTEIQQENRCYILNALFSALSSTFRLPAESPSTLVNQFVTDFNTRLFGCVT